MNKFLPILFLFFLGISSCKKEESAVNCWTTKNSNQWKGTAMIYLMPDGKFDFIITDPYGKSYYKPASEHISFLNIPTDTGVTINLIDAMHGQDDTSATVDYFTDADDLSCEDFNIDNKSSSWIRIESVDMEKGLVVARFNLDMKVVSLRESCSGSTTATVRFTNGYVSTVYENY